MTSPRPDITSDSALFRARDGFSPTTEKPAPSNGVPTPLPSPRTPLHVVVDRDDPPMLTVTTLASNQAMVLVVAGDIDMDTAPILHHALQSAAVLSPRLMVVDLSAVRFLACAGLAELMDAHHRAGDRTCLRVVASGRAVLRSLELGGLGKQLNVCRTRAQALVFRPGRR